MPDSPWLALRQAKEAVSNQRPEDAHRLLEPLIAEGYRKAWRLARSVVQLYVARATKSLDRGDPDAAWRDLLAAESLNTGESTVADLRHSLARLGLAQARAALEAGAPLDAVEVIGRLQERGVRHPDIKPIEEVAQDWVMAGELADRGEFLRAAVALDKLAPKLPCPPTGFEQYRAEVERRHTEFRNAVSRLYDAAEANQWRDALTAAEEVLIVAPDHREAKAIRGQAWLAAVPAAGDNGRGPEPAGTKVQAVLGTASGTIGESARGGQGTLPYVPPGNFHPTAPVAGHVPLPKRFLLWVDGVGGYLVCLSHRVTVGQAMTDVPVDVPLFADLSRLHAELSRDGEGYVLESSKGALVNGKMVTRSVLAADDRVTLGASCQFLFHRPVTVSGSARLELTSGHRLPVAVDGVLLMANELILGSGSNAHVPVPGVSDPILIYRSKDGLGVRVPKCGFHVNDCQCSERAALPLPAVVSTDVCTFAIEPVTGRL